MLFRSMYTSSRMPRLREASSSSCTSFRRRDSMLYDLRHADARIKWLVTCLLATLGLSYVFGALMVALRSEEHTSELQSRLHLVCRLLLEKKKKHAWPSGTTRSCTHRETPACAAGRL